MAHRFYLNSEISDGHAQLSGDQAHHALHVMRLRVGDELVLFDGRGWEHVARISAIQKQSLELEIKASQHVTAENRCSVFVAVALPKGDRQKFLIEKLVELNVTGLIPLKTSRSVSLVNDQVAKRLERNIIEASKQCERNVLMSLAPQHTLAQLIKLATAGPKEWPGLSPAKTVDGGQSSSATTDSACLFLVADPSADCHLMELIKNPAPEISAVIVAIGPEGGFSDDELIQFESQGWSKVGLGPTILRIETAAIVAAVLMNAGFRIAQVPAEDLAPDSNAQN